MISLTNTINSSLYLSSIQDSNRKVNNNLGKDEFLKLLMVQMQNQDPTEPLKDTEYIAQLAQFSSLEQMTNMTSAIEKLVASQNESQLISYSQFVGKEVTWHNVDISTGQTVITEGTSKIVSISYSNGEVTFGLEDGTKIGPGNITAIKEIPEENSVVQASLMIGKTIYYTKEDNIIGSGKVSSVSFKDGVPTFELEDGSKVTSKQITKVE